MTQIHEIEEKCSVCGETSEQPVLISTNSWGYPDLDLRPPEMQRSTMHVWIQECPHCGYVAGKLTDELQIPKEFLKSDEYNSCDGFDFKSDLAARFYKLHMIARESGDLETSFYSLRNCIWKCDDVQDELAVEMRKRAVELADELIERDTEDKEILILMKADFLRRSGQFDRLVEEYENIALDDENCDKVLRYQIEKAKEQDDKCYTTEEIFSR